MFGEFYFADAYPGQSYAVVAVQPPPGPGVTSSGYIWNIAKWALSTPEEERLLRRLGVWDERDY